MQQEYDESIRYYLKNYPGPVSEAVRLRARKLLERLTRITPFKSKSAGNKKVASELRKVAEPIGVNSFEDPRIRHLVRSKNVAVLQKIADVSKHKALKGKEIVLFSADMHDRARNRRGNVRPNKDTLAINRVEWNRHLRKMKGAVGALKSAFAVAIGLLGGKSPPKWLNRPNMLGFKDRSSDRKKPMVVIRNKADYTSRYENLIHYAARIEAKVMLKDLTRRLKEVGKKSGLKTR